MTILELVAIIIGQKIHIWIILARYENDTFIASMLVDMYTKCEYRLDACMVFDKFKHDAISRSTNVFTHNGIIVANQVLQMCLHIM